MAFQPVNNLILSSNPSMGAQSSVTLNAAGESTSIIGRVVINGNTGTKTISAAGGGKIVWLPNGATFSNGATLLDIGIQDVDLTTGLEDGTNDVAAQLVGGVDAIASSLLATAMETGTKTITNGDLIAIVINMPARGGTDFVAVMRSTLTVTSGLTGNGMPYGTTDTATLVKTTAAMLWAFIIFDDGTLGWIQGMTPRVNTVSSRVIADNLTPDELIGTFECTFAMQICGIGQFLSDIATGETFEFILFEDPYGTPVVLETVNPDPDATSGAAASAFHMFTIPKTTLVSGVVYGISFRPTTSNNYTYYYADLTGAPEIKNILSLKNLKLAARTNQTGAFVEVDTDYCPLIALDVCGLDDGTGGGGGGGQHAYVG